MPLRDAYARARRVQQSAILRSWGGSIVPMIGALLTALEKTMNLHFPRTKPLPARHPRPDSILDDNDPHPRVGMNSRRIVLIIAIAVIALTVTTLGCGSEPESSPATQSPGAGSTASDSSRETAATMTPRPTEAATAANSPTQVGSTDSPGQSSGTQPQQGQTARPTATPRPATPTPSPEPAPTVTSEVHTQTGGSVIMQAPTSTPTPPPTPAPTATPVPGPYWKKFTNEEYNKLLPPTGSIQWPKDGYCRSTSKDFGLENITPEGISDRMEWLPREMSNLLNSHIGTTSVENLVMEHPDLFDESGFTQFCGYAQAIHPNVPVIRVNFEMNVRDDNESWQDDRGRIRNKWDAYRVEMRYILVDNPEERGDQRYKTKQHGPILIEKLNSPCDRTTVYNNPKEFCLTPP